ncbi:hypothetical protein [Pseudomonas songnenensis]|uniref:Uncharacterized protein n=1 Tax=Pseudomonas songnenensis TaxID=1176259 RepID=A0A482UIQ0_9PSED|nr:hypothetical protein [Pseudomonas songnenensis]RYJ63300.1 hypothetical protein EJA06_004930 [Pseudomonas songnenensis]
MNPFNGHQRYDSSRAKRFLKSCLFATFADFSTPGTPEAGGVTEISCRDAITLIDDDKRLPACRWFSVARKTKRRGLLKRLAVECCQRVNVS